MRLRKRSSKIASLLVIATTALAGSTAVASAAPATFTPASGSLAWLLNTSLVIAWPVSPTTTVTYTCAGAPSPVNQVFQATTFSNSGSPLQGRIASLWSYGQLTCGSTLGGTAKIWVRSTGELKAQTSASGYELTTPTGLFLEVVGGPVATGGTLTVPWTNPTGAPGLAGLPGITFNSTPVAQALAGPVRFTGTFKASPSTLTLS